MGNEKYERARARARLALIAPTVDDVTAAYFDGQVEKVLREARQREEKSDRELVSTLLDAVARKYFSIGLRDRDSERSPDDSPPRPSRRSHEACSQADCSPDLHLSRVVNLIHLNVKPHAFAGCKLMHECALSDLALTPPNTYL